MWLSWIVSKTDSWCPLEVQNIYFRILSVRVQVGGCRNWLRIKGVWMKGYQDVAKDEGQSVILG